TPGPLCPWVRVGRQATGWPRMQVHRATGHARASCEPPCIGLRGGFHAGNGTVVEMAGDETVMRRPERRLLPAAALHGTRTARVKAAARWWPQWAWDLARQDDFVAAFVRMTGQRR